MPDLGEMLRQAAGLLFGIGLMASIVGVWTGVITATGPGGNTTAWGSVAVCSVIAFCVFAVGLAALGG